MKLALTTLAVLSGLVFGATSASAANEKAPASESKEFETAGLTAVLVQNKNGDVKISESSGRAKVTAHKKKFGPTCEMTIERREEKLGVVVRNRGFVDNDDCQVDFDIQVPKKTRVELALGSGAAHLHGLDSALAYKLGSGSIQGDGRFTKVEGEAGSGKVDLKGLSGDASLKAGSGSYDLVYGEAPKAGALNIELASGNVVVSFPKGAKIRTEMQSVAGHVSNALGETPDAKFVVSMKAASGNLKIQAH